MERFCKICRRKIKHDYEIDICESCMKKGFEVLEHVLKDIAHKKKK